MKKIITYCLLIIISVPVVGKDGLQLFGSKRGAEKEQADKRSSFNQDGEVKQDFSSSEVSSRKNIESVIPVKRIPGGDPKKRRFWAPHFNGFYRFWDSPGHPQIEQKS